MLPYPNSTSSYERRRAPRKNVWVLALFALGACASGSKVSSEPPSENDQSFIDDSGANTVYPGQMRHVGKIMSGLREEYEAYPFYDQQDSWGDDIDNGISFSPRRYRTDFREGDGTGSDTVCEDLQVPEGAKYVQAVTDSAEDAWVAFDIENMIAHLCYRSEGNPGSVAVWAGAAEK